MASAIETPPPAKGGPLSSLPKAGRLAIYIGVPVGIFVLMLVWIFGNINSTRNTLIDKGTTLNAQYQANQTELDAFVKKIREEYQVAGVKAEALDKILQDAVRGRYGDGSNIKAAIPGTPGGALISAIQEAYPDLGGLNVYDRLITEISAGRENFKQVQIKLLDMVRDYKTYRTKGLFHAWFVGKVGYPELQARLGLTQDCPASFVAGRACVYTGKPALEQMQLIVTSGDTNSDFTTGTEAPLLPPATVAPATTLPGSGG